MFYFARKATDFLARYMLRFVCVSCRDVLCRVAEPNTPGKFIVWFRNETTLLVLWQPPYPPGAYTHYKVCVCPLSTPISYYVLCTY